MKEKYLDASQGLSPKGAKDKVKRPKGPTARSRGPEPPGQRAPRLLAVHNDQICRWASGTWVTQSTRRALLVAGLIVIVIKIIIIFIIIIIIKIIIIFIIMKITMRNTDGYQYPKVTMNMEQQ